MGSVFPREKEGVESVPCRMLTSVTGLASRASFVDACCAIVGVSALRFASSASKLIAVGVIAAAAASPVPFKKERRLVPRRLFDSRIKLLLL
jgi:hypothetical protein